MEPKDKWQVIFLGVKDGYGIAQKRVDMLELACRGMAMERAQEICALLNARAETPITKRRA
jgi:hypothetical protein